MSSLEPPSQPDGASPTRAAVGPFEPGAPRKPRFGDECELTFERLDARGLSVGRCGAFTLRERGAPIGGRVRARVLARRRDELLVRTLAVLEPAPDAAVPRCRHHGTCGGCTLQGMSIEAQLAAKGAALVATLRAAGLDPRPAEECELVPSPSPWHYRGKMDFTFGSRRWTVAGETTTEAAGPTLGLFPRGVHSKVLEIEECAIAFEGADAIVRTARNLAREQGLDAYDTREHRGLLRHLVLRRSTASGEILAALVTTEPAPERVEPLVAALAAAHPELTTLVQLVNTGRSLVAVGESSRVHFGPGAIRERLGGLWFEIQAESFFQVNVPAAERLVERVVEAADLRPTDTIHDLYSGCGTLTLALARRAGADARVHGFELVAPAVDAARKAALENGLAGVAFPGVTFPGVTFHWGDVLETWRAESALAAPDVVVADPPRAGLHPKVLAALAASPARRVVLVACEARSGARDAAVLVAGGYRLERVAAVDLFPHTPHLECVLTLARGS